MDVELNEVEQIRHIVKRHETAVRVVHCGKAQCWQMRGHEFDSHKYKCLIDALVVSLCRPHTLNNKHIFIILLGIDVYNNVTHIYM